jgi:hypothetical protein
MRRRYDPVDPLRHFFSSLLEPAKATTEANLPDCRAQSRLLESARPMDPPENDRGPQSPIRASYRRAGKNRSQFQRAIGAACSTILNWEHGRARPDADHLVRVAGVTGVAVGESAHGLAGRSGRPRQPRIPRTPRAPGLPGWPSPDGPRGQHAREHPLLRHRADPRDIPRIRRRPAAGQAPGHEAAAGRAEADEALAASPDWALSRNAARRVPVDDATGRMRRVWGRDLWLLRGSKS